MSYISKKAMVVLKETSDKLKIQAEKARQDFNAIAKEVKEEGREYLSTSAENFPEPIKDIVETFASSPDNLKEISQVRDFYLGIPYGFLFSFGGFLSFMITGSIPGIRFGVILGGNLLASSIFSLRTWKRGEVSSMALMGQADIVLIGEIGGTTEKDAAAMIKVTGTKKPIVAFIAGLTAPLERSMRHVGAIVRGGRVEHRTKSSS